MVSMLATGSFTPREHKNPFVNIHVTVYYDDNLSNKDIVQCITVSPISRPAIGRGVDGRRYPQQALPMLDDTGRLSSRQEKFVAHYALCGNAAEAARLAGYSAKTARVIGPENLTKPAVKAALVARQRVFREELKLTKDDVVSGLLSAIKLAQEQQNPSAMISGLAQIAKLCGFYEPEVSRIEFSGEAERLKLKFATMPDDELLAMISAGG